MIDDRFIAIRLRSDIEDAVDLRSELRRPDWSSASLEKKAITGRAGRIATSSTFSSALDMERLIALVGVRSQIVGGSAAQDVIQPLAEVIT
ncbi:hypothetical protein [Sphingomonas sp. CFBP 8760]|uniref:hypothetical protein n=1 Tax=Sphingomonas sp. CFBP 8760 TaxID=2775282 RepID=UPI001785039F|nr:hypothetical protein [Sphingomonas sp. CFBP 8760]MBD8548257.1 hypothetical protein [Sphingomonas sp. CFBP 8760]